MSTSNAAPGPVTPPAAAPTPSARSEQAARSVITAYGGPLLGLPGTHLAARRSPRPPLRDLQWNYWWQAHYLDAIVDAGARHLREDDRAGAQAYAHLGTDLLRAVWLRNVGHFTNGFFDDMAWMILAAGRLGELGDALTLAPLRAVRAVLRRVAPKLVSAHTPELGGGLYWTTRRDRKNVPATAPAAIYFARTGEVDRARELIAWIYATLYEPATGLILDTAYVDGRFDRTVYSYNQGTVLGALLSVGDPADLDRAADLVRAVDAHERVDAARPTLRTYGDGDGGLFSGILARYLALAAGDERLAPDVRRMAAALVSGTADALWAGSEVRRVPREVRVFSPDPLQPAAQAAPSGTPLDLSPQLQAWTILEAAATPAVVGFRG